MSRAQREAVVILMDVGKNTTVGSGKCGKTFFERAKDCVKKIILRKLLTRPGDEIGVILFGCDETKNDLNSSGLGFENIVEMDMMKIASWDTLRAIDDVKQGSATCDWVDALLIAINYTKNETEAKKFSKVRIILLTNFMNECNDDDLEVILKNISDNFIELIGVSDTVEYDSSTTTKLLSCQFTQNPNKTENQSNSEKIFQKLVSGLDSAILCHIDYVESQLLHYQKKTVRSMPWNVALTIGSKLSISVSAYVYVQDEKFFGSFKTECIEDNTETKYVTEYYKNNELIEKPDEDDMLKAYMYGSKLIPIDDPNLTYKGGDKCLSCLAFCKRDKVPQEYFIGDGCHMVVPQKNFLKSAFLFAALVQSMINQNYLMFARKVYRNNAKTQIVALIPQIEDETYYLIMYELPFSEDIKYHTFPRLQSKSSKPNDEQMDAMKKLVELMDLTNAVDDDSGITEAFTQDSMMNPYYQNMCRNIAFRALNPNESLPSIDEELMKLIDTPEKVKERMSTFISEFENIFPHKIVPFREKKPLGQTDKADDFINADNYEIFTEIQTDERAIIAVGSVTPIEDFIYLLKQGKNRFSILCDQIQSIIYEFMFKSFTDMSEKILETIVGYREIARIHGPLQYNKWIAELKTSMIKRNKVDEWNKIIVKEGLGLISNNESPVSLISIEEQVEFYEVISKDNSHNITTVPVEDEDLEALL